MPRTALVFLILVFVAGSAIGQPLLRLGGASVRPVHEPFSEPITARKIRTAIDDAVMFLRSQQRPDGSVTSFGNLADA